MTDDAVRDAPRGASTAVTPTLRVRRLLALAATPTFAAMAAISVLDPASRLAALCSPMLDPSASMSVMYALMGLFHAGPWLRLLERGRVG